MYIPYAQKATKEQLSNFIVFRNLKGVYKILEPYIQDGFENKPAEKSDYDMFIKLNLNRSRIYPPKNIADSGGIILTECQITQGSLVPINLVQNAVDNNEDVLYYKTNLQLGNLNIDSNTTVAQFSQAVVQNNDGFEYDDIISFIYAIQYSVIVYSDFQLSGSNVTLIDDDTRKLYDVVEDTKGFHSYNRALAMKIDNYSQLYGNVAGVPFAWVHSRKEQIGYTNNYNKYISTQYLDGGTSGVYGTDTSYRQALMSYGYDWFENDYSDSEKSRFLFKHHYPPIETIIEI